MSRIYIGYYFRPHIWINKDMSGENTDLAYYEINYSPGIDIGIQKQGLVVAAFPKTIIPHYSEATVCNVINSEIAEYALTFFNAFSFAMYDANLKKNEGRFFTISQEVMLYDLYLWPNEGVKSIEDTSHVQPFPIEAGEYFTFTEMIDIGQKTIGQLTKVDKTIRSECGSDVFSIYLNRKLLLPNVYKLIALLNRAIVLMRNASFDGSLINLWTIIETILKSLWDEYLNGKRIAKKRIEYLTGKDVSASLISEFLNLNCIISSSLYEKITIARRCRNKFMHEMKYVSPDILKTAYEAIEELISIKYGYELMHRSLHFLGDIYKNGTP